MPNSPFPQSKLQAKEKRNSMAKITPSKILQEQILLLTFGLPPQYFICHLLFSSRDIVMERWRKVRFRLIGRKSETNFLLLGLRRD